VNVPDPIDRVLNETLERGNALIARRNDITAMVSWNRIREYKDAYPVLKNAINYIVDLETIQQTRTITTVEELDALPDQTVIIDAAKVVYQKDVDGPWCDGPHEWQSTEGTYWDVDNVPLPVTVLYEPAGAE